MYLDTVNCPYCGYENDMSDGCVDLPDDNIFDSECEKCGKEFEVEVEFYPSYSAGKIIYEECERCNDKVRDIVKRGRICPYPKNIKEDKLCRECFSKLLSKDFYS